MPIAISDRARALALPPSPADIPALLPPAGLAAATDALDRRETHYSDRPGIAPLRTLIAKRLSEGGLPVAPNEVIVTCGVEEARFVAMTVLGGLGPVDCDEQALGALAALTGATLGSGDGAALWRVGPARLPGEGVAVVEVDGAQVPPTAKGRANTLLIGELPMAGQLRCGFIAASALDPKAFRDFKQALTICTTNISQWIALGLMEARA